MAAEETKNVGMEVAAEADETGKSATEEQSQREDSEPEVGEAATARRAMTPAQPSQKEIDEHELTHANFRSWCIHCQKGKAHNGPHQRRKEEDDPYTAKPVISIVHFYMEAEYRIMKKDQYLKDIEGNSPILSVHDSKTRAIFAHDMKEK